VPRDGRTPQATEDQPGRWPDQLNLKVLHQNPREGDPMGEDFNYAEEFKTLDLAAVKKDLYALMTDSQEWWPGGLGSLRGAVHPHAWHAPAPTAPATGGAAPRPATSASRRSTAGPTTQPRQGAAGCCGRSAEVRPKDLVGRLLVLAGNCALESMGFKTSASAGGRRGLWSGGGHRLGPPRASGSATERYSGDRGPARPYGAVQMGADLKPSIRRGRTASPTRSPRAATSARPSRGWR